MEISLRILQFELEERGYRCDLQTESDQLYKGIHFLPQEIGQFDPEYIYVADTGAARNLSSRTAAVLCGDLGNAEELQCEYIWVKAIDDVQTLMNHLMSIQYELNAEETKLLGQIAQGASLTECVDTVSEIMGNPVYIIDASFKLLAISSQPDLPLVSMHFRRMIQHGYLPITTVVQLLADERWNRDIEQGEPSIMDIAPFYNRFINCKIKIKSKLQGHLFVVQLNRRIVPRDVEIIKQLMRYIKLVIARERPEVAVQGKYYEHFLHDVISGVITDKQMIKEQLQPLHWSPECLYSIMYCPINVQPPYITQMLIDDLTAMRDAKPVSFGTAIYCVFPLPDIQYYSELRQRLSVMLTHYKLSAGLSSAFYGFYHLSKYSGQAALAYELGMTAGDNGNIFPYSNYAVTHLLSLYKKASPVECFYHKALVDLEQFDASHNSQYGHTLHTYLLNERSVARSAEKLNIHKNTLLHRIARIEEITGLTFDDPDTRLHILLSYEMKNYTEKG